MNRQKLLSVVGLIAVLVAAVGPQIGALYPRTALPVAVVGIAAAAVGRSLTRFSNPTLAVIATVTGVCGAVAPLLAPGHEQLSALLLIVGGAAAACAGQLFGVDVAPPAINRQSFR